MTPELCKAARALARLTQREVASEASVSTQTVADFERGARQPHPNNVSAIKRTLEGHGVLFIEEEGRLVGVRKA